MTIRNRFAGTEGGRLRLLLTRWVNTLGFFRIGDVVDDIPSGTTLVDLVEKLEGTPIRNINRFPTVQQAIHRNYEKVVRLLLSKPGVARGKLPSTAEFFSGEPAWILSIVYEILMIYTVRPAQKSAPGILKWANRVLSHYKHSVGNLESDFADGVALCFIAHFYLPDQLPLHQVIPKPRNNADKITNLSLAMKAFCFIRIPSVLDAEDILHYGGTGQPLIFLFLSDLKKRLMARFSDTMLSPTIQHVISPAVDASVLPSHFESTHHHADQRPGIRQGAGSPPDRTRVYYPPSPVMTAAQKVNPRMWPRVHENVDDRRYDVAFSPTQTSRPLGGIPTTPPDSARLRDVITDHLEKAGVHLDDEIRGTHSVEPHAPWQQSPKHKGAMQTLTEADSLEGSRGRVGFSLQDTTRTPGIGAFSVTANGHSRGDLHAHDEVDNTPGGFDLTLGVQNRIDSAVCVEAAETETRNTNVGSVAREDRSQHERPRNEKSHHPTLSHTPASSRTPYPPRVLKQEQEAYARSQRNIGRNQDGETTNQRPLHTTRCGSPRKTSLHRHLGCILPEEVRCLLVEENKRLEKEERSRKRVQNSCTNTATAGGPQRAFAAQDGASHSSTDVTSQPIPARTPRRKSNLLTTNAAHFRCHGIMDPPGRFSRAVQTMTQEQPPPPVRGSAQVQMPEESPSRASIAGARQSEPRADRPEYWLEDAWAQRYNTPAPPNKESWRERSRGGDGDGLTGARRLAGSARGPPQVHDLGLDEMSIEDDLNQIQIMSLREDLLKKAQRTKAHSIEELATQLGVGFNTAQRMAKVLHLSLPLSSPTTATAEDFVHTETDPTNLASHVLVSEGTDERTCHLGVHELRRAFEDRSQFVWVLDYAAYSTWYHTEAEEGCEFPLRSEEAHMLNRSAYCVDFQRVFNMNSFLLFHPHKFVKDRRGRTDVTRAVPCVSANATARKSRTLSGILRPFSAYDIMRVICHEGRVRYNLHPVKCYDFDSNAVMPRVCFIFVGRSSPYHSTLCFALSGPQLMYIQQLRQDMYRHSESLGHSFDAETLVPAPAPDLAVDEFRQVKNHSGLYSSGVVKHSHVMVPNLGALPFTIRHLVMDELLPADPFSLYVSRQHRAADVDGDLLLSEVDFQMSEAGEVPTHTGASPHSPHQAATATATHMAQSFSQSPHHNVRSDDLRRSHSHYPAGNPTQHALDEDHTHHGDGDSRSTEGSASGSSEVTAASGEHMIADPGAFRPEDLEDGVVHDPEELSVHSGPLEGLNS